MRHLPLETGATGQIDADFVQLRLQLQGRDVPSRGVGEVAGGAADAGSNIEHAARRSKPERFRRRTNGVGAVIVLSGTRIAALSAARRKLNSCVP